MDHRVPRPQFRGPTQEHRRLFQPSRLGLQDAQPHRGRAVVGTRLQRPPVPFLRLVPPPQRRQRRRGRSIGVSVLRPQPRTLSEGVHGLGETPWPCSAAPSDHHMSALPDSASRPCRHDASARRHSPAQRASAPLSSADQAAADAAPGSAYEARPAA